MTTDEALAIVASKAAGRTRYEGQESFPDEILAAEVRRLRGVIVSLCEDAADQLSAKYSLRHLYQSERRHYETGMAEINEYLHSVGARTKAADPKACG